MKTANLNNYVNLLNDVYAQGYISTILCRKHKLNSLTTRSLRELKYCNHQGKSLIIMQPSVKDAKKVIAKNRQNAQNYNAKKRQTQIIFPKEKPIISKVQLNAPDKIAKQTEISLFWGMIKIKRYGN